MSAVEFELFKSVNPASNSRFGLGRVLQPLDETTFFEEYWEKKPLLLQRQAEDYYADLFSLRDLDYIISSTELRFPTVRMVKDGVSVPLANFAEDVAWGSDIYYGTIIPEKLYREYRQGASVVFQALHRGWKPLALFCRDLEKRLHHHVQTNLYLTPKAAQGFKPHYDTHDVFILQIAGNKYWKIYEPPLPLPHRSQPSDNARLLKEPGRLVMEFDLKAGDLLYLPRGYVHEALTSDSESLHITVGVTAFTYIEVLNEVINEALQHAKQEALFRHALPVGFTGEEPLEAEIKTRFLELVTESIEQSNFEAIAARLHQRLINQRAPIMDEHLLQLSRLDRLEITQVVCQRPANLYRFFQQGNQVFLEFHGKTISFPDYVEKSLQFILDKDEQPFAIGEIGGVLDDEGKIVLARRLIVEGFLRLA
jgi:ribosomal protein L16 Arg81 hydroxylase